MKKEKISFEEAIEKCGKLVYRSVGDSMMPLIRQKEDLLVIEKIKKPIKKYDVPLYKRETGEYVLHRILKVRKKDYVICGDNRWHKEYGITDRHIIGILTGIIKNGKVISVTDKHYLLYVHIWCDLFPLRAIILRINYVLKKRRKYQGKSSAKP